jgi:signal peptidase II
MITGLVGNLIDRIVYGSVIDFINLKFWPIFNVADILISIGALILIIGMWHAEKEEKKKVNNTKQQSRKKSFK